METATIKYVIVDSNQFSYIKPFRGCFPLIKATKSFYFFRVTRVNQDGTEEEIEKISKNRAWVVNEDVSEAVNMCNEYVRNLWEDHKSSVDKMIQKTIAVE